MIYLACPYTHADPAIRRQRFDDVNRLAARLVVEGELVFSPISHSHAITEAGAPMDWEFWQRFDLWMLARCDSLLVYCLDGWDVSVGVRAEVQAAKAAGKPVRFHLPEMEDRIRRLEEARG